MMSANDDTVGNDGSLRADVEMGGLASGEPTGVTGVAKFEKYVLLPSIVLMLMLIGVRTDFPEHGDGPVFDWLFLMFLLVFLAEIPMRCRYGTKWEKRWLHFCGPVTLLLCVPGLVPIFAALAGAGDLRLLTTLRMLRICWFLRAVDLVKALHRNAMGKAASGRVPLAILSTLFVAIFVSYLFGILLVIFGGRSDEDGARTGPQSVPEGMMLTVPILGLPVFMLHAAFVVQRTKQARNVAAAAAARPAAASA